MPENGVFTEQEVDYAARTVYAAQEYLDRKARVSHPEGKCDRGGRWYPSEKEMQVCCNHVRTPSRAWPWSYMTHCRTLAHVAHLYGVEEADVRAAVKVINAAQKEVMK